jgi:RimJ/RimL family protein N-acetyltransferase
VEDAPALNSIANQADTLKWMPDWKSNVEGTENLIKWFVSQYPLANKSVARVMFAVELRGSVIGMVGIGNKKEADNEIEIAYFISETQTGKGYISEAAKAISQWALDALKMDYLIAIVETDNYPSQRVVEKCGFQKIDTRMILNSGEIEEKPFFYYRLYNT